MIRSLSLSIAVLLGLFSTHLFAGEDSFDFRYLKDTHVEWKDERLTGEIKDAPVKDLLEEFSWKDGFDLEIIGDVSERVYVSFDHLTIEESIKKIMRLTRLSYVLVTNLDAESEDKGAYFLSKLIICGKGKTSFSSKGQRRQPRENVSKVEERPPPHEKEEPPTPSQEPPQKRRKPRKAASKRIDVGFEGNQDDFKEYVEEIAKEGKISSEEYEMILEKMGSEKR